MASVTVRIASRLTGKDRTTITRMIEKGKLSATKDDSGRFLIDPAELERVFGTLHRVDDAEADAMHEDARDSDASALAREVKLLREMLEQERASHERERRTWQDDRQLWEGERTFLRDLVTTHTEQIKLLTDQREQERHSPSLFGWFRRRS